MIHIHAVVPLSIIRGFFVLYSNARRRLLYRWGPCDEMSSKDMPHIDLYASVTVRDKQQLVQQLCQQNLHVLFYSVALQLLVAMGGAVSRGSSAATSTSETSAPIPGLPFGIRSTKNGFFSKYCFSSPLEVLREDGYAKVVKGHARGSSGEAVALKCISMKDFAYRAHEILREKDILMTLSHGHILKCYDYYEDAANGWIWVVLELVREELFDRIQAKTFYSEKDARSSCIVLLDILAYLHDRDIAQ